MEKSKKSIFQPYGQDRLSELPDCLIFHILWFVPMSDVVRTTVLSKRWKNLWTTIPFLNFDNYSLSVYEKDIFRNFVNRALLRWSGIKIQKFKVDSFFEIDYSLYSDTELWVNFAKEKKVEELYLHMMSLFDFYNGENFESIGDQIYWVPPCLYSCSSLKVLSFRVCYFRINGINVQWNQLKSLTITECFGITEHVINQILSGSPRLEVLNLSFVDHGDENLHIRSNSLKKLSICKYLLYHDQYISDLVSLVSELTICTPNLETLLIEGFPFTNCQLINVSSLNHATIGFYGLIYGEPDDCINDFRGIGLENGFVSAQDYIGDNFIQILQTIQHVESVTLYYCCLKVLGAMKRKCMHSSFPNVKSLKIGYCYDDYEELVGLREIFPQLERLVLPQRTTAKICMTHSYLTPRATSSLKQIFLSPFSCS